MITFIHTSQKLSRMRALQSYSDKYRMTKIISRLQSIKTKSSQQSLSNLLEMYHMVMFHSMANKYVITMTLIPDLSTKLIVSSTIPTKVPISKKVLVLLKNRKLDKCRLHFKI